MIFDVAAGDRFAVLGASTAVAIRADAAVCLAVMATPSERSDLAPRTCDPRRDIIVLAALSSAIKCRFETLSAASLANRENKSHPRQGTGTALLSAS